MKLTATRLHLITLAVALVDLWAFLIFSVSFRGQWLDILLSILPFIFAAFALISRWRRMLPARRAYFISFVVLNLLATPVYLFATIPFSMPTLDRLGRYEARSRPGFLLPEAAIILEGYGPFERQVSDMIFGDQFQLSRERDSLFLTMPQYDRPDSAIAICAY